MTRTLVITVDRVKNDLEQKVLVGCTRAEAKTIHDFHNGNGQNGILIWRADD